MPSHSHSEDSAGSSERIYTWRFFLCYLSNVCLMTAVSSLFRYADLLKSLKGGEVEAELGLITGVGMLGGLTMRFFLGVSIDRYGARCVWMLSLASYVLCALAHLAVSSVDGPGIYLAQIWYRTSTAGAFGASLTYISLLAPPKRMGEMLGVLGSSGFVGMALGPYLCDQIFQSQEVQREEIVGMYYLAAGACFLSLLLVVFATSGHAKTHAPKKRRSVPLWWLVRRYHPGALLFAGAAMGLAIGMPHSFLRTYADELGVHSIRHFFLAYAATAFILRIITRKFPDRFGVRPVMLLGLSAAAASMTLYLLVDSAATLVIPALGAGFAHAFLFPAAMAGGAAAFPQRHRGVATTLMLAMFDIGNLVGQPLIGGIIYGARRTQWPAYPTMFLSLMAILIVTAGIYYWEGRKAGDH